MLKFGYDVKIPLFHCKRFFRTFSYAGITFQTVRIGDLAFFFVTIDIDINRAIFIAYFAAHAGVFLKGYQLEAGGMRTPFGYIMRHRPHGANQAPGPGLVDQA